MGFRLRGGEVDGFTDWVGGCVRVVRSVAPRFSDGIDTGISHGRLVLRCGVYDTYYHRSARATKVSQLHHS